MKICGCNQLLTIFCINNWFIQWKYDDSSTSIASHILFKGKRIVPRLFNVSIEKGIKFLRKTLQLRLTIDRLAISEKMRIHDSHNELTPYICIWMKFDGKNVEFQSGATYDP